MSNAVTEAERKIGAILRDLEVQTGSVVEAVELRDIETTRMESERQEFQRRVVVDLKRLPGTNWHA
jgi:hypothetical protein